MNERRGNRLERTIAESRSGQLEVGRFQDLLIDTDVVAHSIPYIAIRQRVLFKEKDTILFEGDGYAFAVTGDNMVDLLRMINLHQLAEISQGGSYHFNGKEIRIHSIIAEPLGGEEDAGDQEKDGFQNGSQVN